MFLDTGSWGAAFWGRFSGGGRGMGVEATAGRRRE